MSTTALKELHNKLDSKVQELIEDIRPHVKAEDLSEIPGTVYQAKLPEGVTVESLTSINEYNKQFMTAIGYVVGEVGNAAVAKNPEFATMKVIASDGIKQGNEFSMSYRASMDQYDPTSKETKVSHGNLRAGFHTNFTRAIGGLGQVTQAVKTDAQKAFTS